MTSEPGQRIALRARGIGNRCAYCHGRLDPDHVCACCYCGTRLHADCAQGLSGCPTLGCPALEMSPPLAEKTHPSDRDRPLAKSWQWAHGVLGVAGLLLLWPLHALLCPYGETTALILGLLNMGSAVVNCTLLIWRRRWKLLGSTVVLGLALGFLTFLGALGRLSTL